MWKGYIVAHELLIDGGRAAMFYVGERPWHKLGTKLEAPPSSEAAIAAAGLDWTVTKVPLYVAAQARLHELRDRFAIVREDKLGSADFPVFGIVGPEYVPLQNSKAFAFFDPIVKNGDATYETAGALGHGERIWIQARLSKDIEVAGDIVERYLLLSNTHNASSSLQVKLTPVRVVCNNTLTVALSKGRSICIRHDHAMDEHLKQAKNLLGLVEAEYAGVAAAFRRMAARKLTQQQAAAYFAQVFPDSASVNPVARQLVANRRRWALHFFHHGEGNGALPVRGTLWAAYNGVTELIEGRQRPRVAALPATSRRPRADERREPLRVRCVPVRGACSHA
jgi:phage/plasmid-like protein (TIGR03299 family)